MYGSEYFSDIWIDFDSHVFLIKLVADIHDNRYRAWLISCRLPPGFPRPSFPRHNTNTNTLNVGFWNFWCWLFGFSDAILRHLGIKCKKNCRRIVILRREVLLPTCPRETRQSL